MDFNKFWLGNKHCTFPTRIPPLCQSTHYLSRSVCTYSLSDHCQGHVAPHVLLVHVDPVAQHVLPASPVVAHIDPVIAAHDRVDARSN